MGLERKNFSLDKTFHQILRQGSVPVQLTIQIFLLKRLITRCLLALYLGQCEYQIKKSCKETRTSGEKNFTVNYFSL